MKERTYVPPTTSEVDPKVTPRQTTASLTDTFKVGDRVILTLAWGAHAGRITAVWEEGVNLEFDELYFSQFLPQKLCNQLSFEVEP
jgi:hypothetical protein